MVQRAHTMSASYIVQYDEKLFQNEFNCATKTKKTKDGETFHLVTHKRRGNRSGYARLGQYINRDMFMDIAIQELMKREDIPHDITNYIMSFISYPSDDEVQSYNMKLYMNAFFNNSIYNSAIFNEKGYMVCVAPCKPMYSGAFCRQFQHDFENIDFFEMVEGHKINAFYHNGKWRLATKYVIDDESNNNAIANFKDACKALNVDLERDLDKQFCYSFIFQTRHLYMVAIHEIDNEDNTLILRNLRDFEHGNPYHQEKYKKNINILFPTQLNVNFDDLELIVKEWGPGDGLPDEIWENDPYEGRYLQHHSGEKGIIMLHKPSGIYTEVYNRNYLHYVIGDKL